jgi:hypothetical protein
VAEEKKKARMDVAARLASRGDAKKKPTGSKSPAPGRRQPPPAGKKGKKTSKKTQGSGAAASAPSPMPPTDGTDGAGAAVEGAAQGEPKPDELTDALKSLVDGGYSEDSPDGVNKPPSKKGGKHPSPNNSTKVNAKAKEADADSGTGSLDIPGKKTAPIKKASGKKTTGSKTPAASPRGGAGGKKPALRGGRGGGRKGKEEVVTEAIVECEVVLAVEDFRTAMLLPETVCYNPRPPLPTDDTKAWDVSLPEYAPPELTAKQFKPIEHHVVKKSKAGGKKKPGAPHKKKEVGTKKEGEVLPPLKTEGSGHGTERLVPGGADALERGSTAGSTDHPKTAKPSKHKAEEVKEEAKPIPWFDHEKTTTHTGTPLVFNSLDGPIDRVSCTGAYALEPVLGLPMNPTGRTGLAGRGVLGRYGPNHGLIMLVSRCKRKGRVAVRDAWDQPVVEYAMLRAAPTPGTGADGWQSPGGIVMSVPDAIKEQQQTFLKTVLSAKKLPKTDRADITKKMGILFSNGIVIQSAYATSDPRNTDNSWVELHMHHFHDETGEATRMLKLGGYNPEAKEEGDTTVGSAHWVEVTPELIVAPAEESVLMQVREDLVAKLESVTPKKRKGYFKKWNRTRNYNQDKLKMDTINELNPENHAVKFFNEKFYKKLNDEHQRAFMRCIGPAVRYPKLAIGCYAHHAQDYTDFSDYFANVVNSYSGYDEQVVKAESNANMKELEALGTDKKTHLKTQFDFAKLGLPFVFIRIEVVRNLASFPLVPAMNKTERLELEELLVKAFDSFQTTSKLKGTYYSLTPGHPNFVDGAQLARHSSSQATFPARTSDPIDKVSSSQKDWPQGRGCYIATDTRFSVTIGGKDHINIVVHQKGRNLWEAMAKARSITDALADAILIATGKDVASTAAAKPAADASPKEPADGEDDEDEEVEVVSNDKKEAREGLWHVHPRFGHVAMLPVRCGSGVLPAIQVPLGNLATVERSELDQECLKLKVQNLTFASGGMATVTCTPHFAQSDVSVLAVVYDAVKELKKLDGSLGRPSKKGERGSTKNRSLREVRAEHGNSTKGRISPVPGPSGKPEHHPSNSLQVDGVQSDELASNDPSTPSSAKSKGSSKSAVSTKSSTESTGKGSKSTAGEKSPKTSRKTPSPNRLGAGKKAVLPAIKSAKKKSAKTSGKKQIAGSKAGAAVPKKAAALVPHGQKVDKHQSARQEFPPANQDFPSQHKGKKKTKKIKAVAAVGGAAKGKKKSPKKSTIPTSPLIEKISTDLAASAIEKGVAEAFVKAASVIQQSFRRYSEIKRQKADGLNADIANQRGSTVAPAVVPAAGGAKKKAAPGAQKHVALEAPPAAGKNGNAANVTTTDKEKDEAATKIQARFRGYQGRKKVKEIKLTTGKSSPPVSAAGEGAPAEGLAWNPDMLATETLPPTKEEIAAQVEKEMATGEAQDAAATKIQAGFRGMKGRQKAKQHRASNATPQAVGPPAAQVEREMATGEAQDAAATKIQAGFRGMKGRQKAKQHRASKATPQAVGPPATAEVASKPNPKPKKPAAAPAKGKKAKKGPPKPKPQKAGKSLDAVGVIPTATPAAQPMAVGV